ncbi:prenylcysteine oxidase isoform X1 [Bombus impatiens]|uniref:Prenylcysteine oxidase isoform X1 n=2 Tax=Bombus impatiens TaxID=132113 RepID=A0A6P3DPZ6_BOMIM|nr:prenylcysteine oxidase isoform X1 [Bombus impatiens]
MNIIIMIMNWRIILLGILIFKRGICYEKCKPNIAIIGGGIGGAASSHFLTELFNNNLNIDLYEAKIIGGRLATIKVDGNEFEAGGSIIHPQNKYMRDFVELLGLEHRPSKGKKTSIWNGNEIIFEESNWEILSFIKLIYRYGVQPFSLNRYVTSIINNFEKIYHLQDNGEVFTNISSLLLSMNPEFPKLLEKSIKSEILNLGYSEKLINELVKTTLVVNYGQDTNVHSFVGFVSLAGAGFNLWSVKGGNKKVPEHLIYRNKHVNVVPSHVIKIINILNNDTQNLYEVHYHNQDSTNIMKATYDIVILAIPLIHNQEFPITFEGFPNNDFFSPAKYHETIATFVKADLKPHYFGLEAELDNILSCDPNRTIISSLGRLNSVEGSMKNSNVWKIFSNKPLKSNIINEMFSNVQEIKQIAWKAYPEYSTKIHEAKFKLHNALYHVNAIEWIASAMEMSAIGGRNVALLAHRDFFRKFCIEKIIQTSSLKKKLRTEL